jgi:hypothetical protein
VAMSVPELVHTSVLKGGSVARAKRRSWEEIRRIYFMIPGGFVGFGMEI